jgi:hypothetical protein
MHCRAHGGGGRGSASPRQGGPAHSRSGIRVRRWGAHPRPVGVRRCLTRRPGRAGRPSRRGSSAVTACRRVPRVAAPMARAGEAAPRPYKVGRRIPGRAHGCDGGALAPSCRGQAVPDPSGPRGRESPDGAMVAVPTGSWTRLTCATGMCRARGAAGELGRRAPTPVSRRVPGTEPPRGQPSVAGSARS